MKILISNDDGIRALGIWSLAAVLAERHEVIITAPMKQQSGMSHALSVLRQVEFLQLKEEQINELLETHCPDSKINNPIEAWTIDGTPTDCVKIYLEAMCEGNYPELVISGINHGANLATDVLYSGTVGAALEGFLHEIPSAAISLDIASEISFEDTARAAVGFIEDSLKDSSNCFLYNINFPKKFKDNKLEFVFTKLGKRDYINAFQMHKDEHGRTYFRVGGQIYDLDRSEGTDIFAADSGFVSVTSLHKIGMVD